ncbi:hypothetical protein DS745_02670 [Anaerobacillus alkaliphilus]|uniref:Uncharacterized protein n=1 Tax=Anaerobacillus alkaliphilus TaxID=1548597 RepID=A0A4Q0VX34_9BACI|nr:hypothetical protein [Anaerobacillus alkaliphilus]RXJ04307.1 hypothetical protein DS745_02670 [Anaerobacillus alkaliphilus]
MKNILLTLVVILLILGLYLGGLTLLLLIMSLFSLIQIDSWIAAIIFSFCVILWSLPFELLGLFDGLSLRSSFGRRVLRLLVVLFQFAVFTFYVIWLDMKFTTISFSNVGMICYIIIVGCITLGVMVGGQKVKQQDGKNKTV